MKSKSLVRRIYGSPLFSVAHRELTLLWRYPSMIILVLAAPLVYPFLYNTVYVNKLERAVPIEVVDLDKSSSSREIIRDLGACDLLSVDCSAPDIETASKRLLALSTTAIVVIPSGFETDVKKKKQTRISVSVSNLKFVAASDVTRGINDVVASIAKDISTNVLKSAGYGSAQAEIAAEPVRPVYANLFNTTGSYGDFIILGILILILQQILLMGMSVSMSLERESKAVGHLFHSAGGSIPAVILGKSAFYFFLFAAHAFVFFTVYAWIYHIPVGGAVPAIIVFTCVHLISIIIWSMFVSSFFKTRLMAMCILLFTSYPLFLLSGFSWPLYCFPWYLQAVAFVLPSTPFFQVFPMITQMHAAWPDILPYLCHMVLLLSVGATALWVRLSIMKRK